MKGFGIYIKNELLDPKHVECMGSSVWLYMWLLDHVTSIDEKGVGKVLGGKPVKYPDIERELGVSADTYTRWIDKLLEYPYIIAIRTPYGISYRVLKTFKRFRKNAERFRKTSESNKDSAKPRNLIKTNTVDSNKDIAAKDAAPFDWKESRRKWYEGIDLRFQLLAWFFDRKKLWQRFDTKEKAGHAANRHIRSATRLVNAGWSQKELERALARMLEANPKMRDEWQLETIEKYLTK